MDICSLEIEQSRCITACDTSAIMASFAGLVTEDQI